MFSSTLQDASWPETTIYRGELQAEVERLKAQDGGPILAHGGARFAQGLTRLELIDEYWLDVHRSRSETGCRCSAGPWT